MTEYTPVFKTRISRQGGKILGCNSVTKKLKIQALIRKFYGKRKDKDNVFKPNPFPYNMINANRKRKDEKLLKDLGNKEI